MSKPRVLHAVDELNENGFYDKSTYLGDIRTTATCLNNAIENGIYVFTGGTSSPTDTTGFYLWSLIVTACQDCTNVHQEAVRIIRDTNYDLVFSRSLSSGTWSAFTEACSKKAYDAASAASSAASAANTAATNASNALSKANAALPLAGGTMTGAITLPGAPTENLHAATKKYVDDNKYTHPDTHPASMITELESVISNLGYSKIVTGSYTGDGVKITRTSAGNDPETYQPLYKYTGGQTITLGFTPSIVVIFSTSVWSIVHITQDNTISTNVYKDGSSSSSPYYIARLSGAELIVGSINTTSSYYWYNDTNQDGYLYYWLAF